MTVTQNEKFLFSNTPLINLTIEMLFTMAMSDILLIHSITQFLEVKKCLLFLSLATYNDIVC